MDWVKIWHIFWLSAFFATAVMAFRARLQLGRRFPDLRGMSFPPFRRILKMPPEVRDEYMRVTVKWFLLLLAVLIVPAAIERYGPYVMLSLGWR